MRDGSAREVVTEDSSEDRAGKAFGGIRNLRRQMKRSAKKKYIDPAPAFSSLLSTKFAPTFASSFNSTDLM